MSANKYKRNQKKCEEYRRSGRRELNKAEKQKKHLARIAHFAKRKEEGKTYKYVPPKDAKERNIRAKKNVDRRLPIAQLDSLFGKLEYQLNQEKLRAKEAAFQKRSKYNKGKKETVSE